MPFGTHDEKGYLRKVPLSEELLRRKHRNLTVIDSISDNATVFSDLLAKRMIMPAIQQTAGDPGWVIRWREYDGRKVVHFMNTKLKALPHPTAKDIGQTAVVKNIESLIQNNVLEFQFDAKKFPVTALALYSPEIGRAHV